MKGKDLCNAIELHIRQGQFQEAAAGSEELLRQYPGHLHGLFLLGIALLRLGEPQQARLHLDAALGLDPESAECRLALAKALRALGESEQSARQFVRAFALFPSEKDAALVLNGKGDALADLKGQGEASPLGRAVRLRLSANWARAQSEFQALARSEPFLPEGWLGLAETLWHLERLDEAMPALEQLASAWPNFVKAKLISGDILVRQGQVEAGMEALHHAQALDPGGIVIQRTLGWSASYAHLWAGDPAGSRQETHAASIPHSLGEDVGVSASAAAAIAAASPSLREIELELNRLTDHLIRTDAPPEPARGALVSALVVLTSKSALEKKFGSEFVGRLGEKVQDMIQSIGLRDDRAIHFVALDDPAQMSGLGATAPQDTSSPAQVKAAIDSLADGLLTQGNDLRHLLILGDDDVIPFFRVSNPTEDQDEDIYTDAPYAARNGSHLLPTRAVGRLPDCRDPDQLLSLMGSAAQSHRQAGQVSPPGGIKALGRIWKRAKAPEARTESFGYTASVWKESSKAVFEAIGQARQLRMSPPLTHRELSVLIQGQPRLSYFNLHGVEGEPAWYGQRDPDFAADYPLFPVALLPEAVKADRIAGTTVFTEACYGADVLGRSPADSIALKFLAEGARAVVGSTRLAYGSLTPPLAGADLLARFFWLAVLSGMPIGQSLQWAKLSFASDVANRQGYLDSEDQKTLLTFNLFGDPTLTVEGQLPIWDKLPQSALVSKSVAVCCHYGAQAVSLPDLPSDLVSSVESQIAHKLPWLSPKQMKVAQQVVCSGQCNGSCRGSAKAHGHAAVANRYVFTVNGSPQGRESARWQQTVKVTVDQRGTILKMAVSKGYAQLRRTSEVRRN